jgi:HD-like signal output (HDOD) protein
MMMTPKSAYNTVRQRLLSLKSLQTQPTVIAEITHLLQNPSTNAEMLGRAIRTDQVLASTVLKLVNSAFYGFPGRIGSISHAVVLLGFSTVKNIVLTATIMDIFKMNINSKFNMRDMWKHSLACGASAQCLARALGLESKEECFIAGLVHDIGKAIMFQLMPDDFIRVIECSDKTKILFYDSESKLLGINHQDIGGILIELWHLPTPILNAVSCHHNPPAQLSEDYKIAAIVHCADILARALGYGNGGDNKIPRINDNVWNSLALDNIDLPRLFDSIEIELERVSALSQL